MTYQRNETPEPHASAPADPFDCQEFHELCMDYRGTSKHMQSCYERLQAYCRAALAAPTQGAPEALSEPSDDQIDSVFRAHRWVGGSAAIALGRAILALAVPRTSAANLPPLPGSRDMYGNLKSELFTKEQMHEYARAALAATSTPSTTKPATKVMGPNHPVMRATFNDWRKP